MKKADFRKWGKILATIGGILFIVGGVLLLLNIVLHFGLGTLESDMIAKGFILRFIPFDILIAVIGIALGVLSIAFPNTKLSDFLLGLLLIIIGIIGIGIPGLLVVISGIFYIVASMKKR
ncbi:MAG: hypothetical protein ACTSQE_08495 [Candidatus Heimdallarchaeaceae archaeon]